MTDLIQNTAFDKGNAKESKRELLEFLLYVKSHLKFLIIPTLAVIVAVILYVSVIATPMYEATSQLYVVNSKDSAINLSDLQIGSYLTSDYQWIFKTWEVNQQVISNLNLPYSIRQMRDQLTVENPSNTRILLITFSSPNAKEAADVANEYASVASQYISDYMLASKPSLISTALEPLTPAKPQKMLTVTFAALIAVFVTLWCLFISFLVDDKIKTPADLRKYLGIEALAVIPSAKFSGAPRKAR